MAKIIGSKPEMGSLIRSILSSQSLDLKLQPHNGTPPTFSPMLKGLRLLEEFWLMADLDHLRTERVHSE